MLKILEPYSTTFITVLTFHSLIMLFDISILGFYSLHIQIVEVSGWKKILRQIERYYEHFVENWKACQQRFIKLNDKRIKFDIFLRITVFFLNNRFIPLLFYLLQTYQIDIYLVTAPFHFGLICVHIENLRTSFHYIMSLSLNITYFLFGTQSTPSIKSTFI